MADFELQGMPVWVYSKDADSKASIAPSRLVEGTVGEHFSLDPADVAGYRFVSSEGTLTGTFDEKTMHTVTFYYRRADIAETEKIHGKYLRMLASVQPVDEIESTTPLGQKLWADSYMKVVERVATRDGKFWYQLADSRWVAYDMQTMKLTDNDGRTTKPVSEWNRPTTWHQSHLWRVRRLITCQVGMWQCMRNHTDAKLVALFTVLWWISQNAWMIHLVSFGITWPNTVGCQVFTYTSTIK